MQEGIYAIIRIVGSLALFTFGMKFMSEAVQRLVGPSLRQYIGAKMRSRSKAVITGLVATALVQSSSAVTVMVVSFVNAGLVKLRQAIAVIMGANIGTTITGWIVLIFAFGPLTLGMNALLIMAFGVPLLFLQRADWKALGEVLIGFSLLFVGIDFLKELLLTADQNQISALLPWVVDGTQASVLSVFGFLLGGALLTIIVQSSSATMTLTLCMVAVGLPLELGAAVVLGENIGTTITANIAADRGNVHAKRAARAHLLFNLIGAIGVLLVFRLFLHGNSIVAELLVNTQSGSNDFFVTQLSLCLFHTSFNLVNALILIWAVDPMARWVRKLVPSKGDDDEEFALQFINTSLQSSEMSLVEAQQEITKFGKVVQKMSSIVSTMLTETELNRQSKSLRKVRKLEQLTDDLEEQIADYLIKVGRLELTREGSASVYSMLSIITDLERVGDIFYVMAKSLESKTESKIYFLPKQRLGVQEMFLLVDQSLEVMVDNLRNTSGIIDIDSAKDIETKIDNLRNQLRKRHLKDTEASKYGIKGGMIYLDLFASLERIGDHVVNVSEALLETD